MDLEQGIRDDSEIKNEVVLWRRIRIQDIYDDHITDKKRPKKSPCFDDSPDRSPLSVTIADEAGVTPEEYLKKYPEEGLVKLTVGQIREKGLGITREPTEIDPAHALVHGKKTKIIKKKLAIECEWVIIP